MLHPRKGFAMADDWVMVRVRKTTAARLRTVEKSLRIAHEQGKIALDFDSQNRVAFDQIIDLLCQRQFEHADRGRKSKRKRREKLARQRLRDLVDAGQLVSNADTLKGE